MREISLHILDIVKNSTVHGATLVEINLKIDNSDNLLCFEVLDNGSGMSKQMVETVLDPFVTTRKTRKVGLGLPLLSDACKASGGGVEIKSQLGKGTSVKASFAFDSIDRMPLGDFGSSISLLIQGDPQIEFVVNVCVNGQSFSLDTREVKAQMGEIPISSEEVLCFIKEFLNENLKCLYGGTI